MHQNASVKCYIHSNIEAYLENLKNQKITVPDVITAADIVDEDGFTGAVSEQYIVLCCAILKNSNVYNLWLDKDRSKDKVFLKTIALDNNQPKASIVGQFNLKPEIVEALNISAVCYVKEEILNKE
jgi:hypothetical protein